jgi:hypothetical protein
MGSVLLVAGLVDGRVLLIVDDREDTSGVFLYEHQTDGSGFDTWHRTVDEAKVQATYQFGLLPKAWLDAAVVTDPRLLTAIQTWPLPKSK